MTKGYLPSPFNDKNFNNIIETIKVIQQNNETMLNAMKPTISFINEIYIPQISGSIQTSIAASRALSESLEPTLNSMNQITKSYSELVKSLPNFQIYTSSFLKAYTSFVENNNIYSEEEYDRSTTDTIVSSGKNNSRIHDTEHINELSIAYINFEIAIQKFKEVFHKSYSYASERKLVIFGLSNAFVYFVTLAAETNPMLPFWFFSVTSVIGLFTPKDK